MIAALPFPDIDPVLFSLDLGAFTLAVRWYALAYIVGFILGWRWVNRALRRDALWPADAAPMATRQTEDLLTYAIVGVILGGRLGYVLFYAFPQFVENPLFALRIWEGGMSFHGGFIGVIVAGWLFARSRGVNPWSVGDCFALAAPIGLFLGRLANFINAELWGRPTDVPWAFVFPGAPCDDGSLCARHPSQLYEAGLEGLLLFAVIGWLAYRRDALKIPGQLVAVFWIGYGLSRFVVEFFRQADIQFRTPSNPLGHVIEFGGTGLTMGQLLSLPMAVAGVAILIWVRRRA